MGLKVVIPVAGKGTRLQPLTDTTPKVLVPVAGKPMLAHILDELGQYDVDEVVLIVGYLGDAIRDYVSSNYSFKVRYVEQETMEGLGHAIWLSKPEGPSSSGPLLIILGDTLFKADFAKIFSSDESWIGVKEVDDPTRFGVVMLDGDRISDMIEKPADPPTNLAIVGIYFFQEPERLYAALDRVVESGQRTAGEIQLTDALKMMVDEGACLKPFEIEAWYDCGKFETLLKTNREMLAGGLGAETGGASPNTTVNSVIIPPVAIAAGAKIEDSVVGPYVTVRPGVAIRGSIVRDSILCDGARVENAQLDGSVLGNSATVQGDGRAVILGDNSSEKLD